MESSFSAPKNVYPIPARHELGESQPRSSSDAPGETEANTGVFFPRPPSPIYASVPIEEIADNPHQTREIESDAEVEELSRSIQTHGIIQPILLRPVAEGASGARYELVAGERRLRAAKLAGLREVPALVHSLDEQVSAELAVVENAQRLDLNPIEEALAYRQLVGRFGLTHQDVARVIGKSRAVVSNALRLLNLDERVIELLKSGELSAGHGRLLLSLEDADEQLRLAQRIIKNGLSVRAVERLLEDASSEEEGEDSEESERLKHLAARQQEKLKEYLNLEQVHLRFDAHGRRRVSLVFDTEASWKRFVSKIR